LIFLNTGLASLEREIQELRRHQLTPLAIPSPTSDGYSSRHFGELFPVTNSSGLVSSNDSSQHEVKIFYEYKM
jgi:hypothetical protein